LSGLKTELEPLPDKGLIARYENWHLAGENMSRLSLHVHADDVATAKRDELVKAVAALRNDRDPLSLASLNEAVSKIAASIGLVGYASNAKCFYDPLETVVDASFYSLSDD